MVDQELPDVRAGLSVGISVSQSEDLGRFGLTETHVRMALGDIARAVLIADGRLVYGGHLQENGYTTFLVREIERFGRRNRPFTGYVPFSEHRRMSVSEISERIEDISVLGRYVFLDERGETIDPTADRLPEPGDVDEATERACLSAARMVMSGMIDGRVSLGGGRDGRGRMPGVIEEVVLAIRGGKAVFIAGGYGGASADMAVALGIDSKNWLGVDMGENQYLEELRQAAADSEWRVEANGLTLEENQRLAITYRASEVASLIVTGLSRLSGTT